MRAMRAGIALMVAAAVGALFAVLGLGIVHIVKTTLSQEQSVVGEKRDLANHEQQRHCQQPTES